MGESNSMRKHIPKETSMEITAFIGKHREELSGFTISEIRQIVTDKFRYQPSTNFIRNRCDGLGIQFRRVLKKPAGIAEAPAHAQEGALGKSEFYDAIQSLKEGIDFLVNAVKEKRSVSRESH